MVAGGLGVDPPCLLTDRALGHWGIGVLGPYLFLTPVLPSPPGGGVTEWFFRTDFWAGPPGNFFGLSLVIKLEKYDSMWLFMDVKPKLEHFEYT